jgi:cob(I)alamin adenosyltransferase
MPNRITKVSTRTGDKGRTGLADGSRIDKDHPRITAIGDIDELNSVIGLLLSHLMPKDIHHSLAEIQHTLFDIGGELSLPGTRRFTSKMTSELEKQLQMYNATLQPLREFVLPGGSEATARCHLARAVCRRAERSAVALSKHEEVNDEILVYLNRLSDLLFVTARVLARIENGTETLWRSSRLTRTE